MSSPNTILNIHNTSSSIGDFFSTYINSIKSHVSKLMKQGNNNSPDISKMRHPSEEEFNLAMRGIEEDKLNDEWREVYRLLKTTNSLSSLRIDMKRNGTFTIYYPINNYSISFDQSGTSILGK